MPVIINPSGSGSVLGKLGLKGYEANEVAEASEVNEAGEVSKASKIIFVDFRVFQVLNNSIILGLTSFHFDVLKKKLTES